MGLAIAYTWLTEGTYDKEYVAEPHHRFRRVEGLRPRQDRRRAQDSGVGRGRERHPGARDPGAGPGVGVQEDHAGRGRTGRHGRRQPGLLGQRVGPHHGGAGRHAGPGQAGQQHLGHHQRRARWTAASCSRATPKAASPATRPTRPPASVSSTACSPTGGHHQPAPHHRRPDRPASAHPRGHAARAPSSGGARDSAARISRASSRGTSIRRRAIPRWRCTTGTAARSSAP